MNAKYGGAYYLDSTGKWRYVHNNKPVPGASTYIAPDGEITMNAPELLAHQVCSVGWVADWLGVKRPTVWKMLQRKDICEPQLSVDGSWVWSLPILEHWKAQRPGKGANLRGRGTAA